MEVIYGNKDTIYNLGPTACALGFFDGVHLGHQKLISILKDSSKNRSLKSMVFTFENHPLYLLNRKCAPRLITDNHQKADIFKTLDVDIINFHSLSMDFLNMSPDKFIEEILIKQFAVSSIVIGFNFSFGADGMGDPYFLKSYCNRKGIDVNIVEPFCMNGSIVNSTTIREFIASGDVKAANKLLGRNFILHGDVVHGKERGRTIGFPTANLNYNKNMIIPKKGVYITKVSINNIKKIGITNIGYNPTFGNSEMTVETHIIDFNTDIYDKHIEIAFYERLRDEVPFKDKEALSKQLRNDKLKAIMYFKDGEP